MPKRHRHYLAALGWICNHAEIDLALDQILVNFVRAQVLEVDIHGWKIAQKFCQVWRQLVQADAVHRADANRAGDHRADFAEPILELQKSPHDLFARGVKNLSGRSWFDSGASAFYQS